MLVLRGINIKDVGVSTCRPSHVQALALPLYQDKQLQSAHAEVYYNVMGTNTTNVDLNAVKFPWDIIHPRGRFVAVSSDRVTNLRDLYVEETFVNVLYKMS